MTSYYYIKYKHDRLKKFYSRSYGLNINKDLRVCSQIGMYLIITYLKRHYGVYYTI